MGRGLFSCLMFFIWYYVVGKLLWYRVVSFACSLWNILFYIIWCSVSSKKGQLFGMENLVHIHRVPCAPLIPKNINKRNISGVSVFWAKRESGARWNKYALQHGSWSYKPYHFLYCDISQFLDSSFKIWTVQTLSHFFNPSRSLGAPWSLTYPPIKPGRPMVSSLFPHQAWKTHDFPPITPPSLANPWSLPYPQKWIPSM